MSYNGSFIPHVLVRPEGTEMDRAALENFDVGEGDEYFRDE